MGEKEGARGREGERGRDLECRRGGERQREGGGGGTEGLWVRGRGGGRREGGVIAVLRLPPRYRGPVATFGCAERRLRAAPTSLDRAQVPTSRRGAGPSPRSLGEGNTESETK